MSAVSTTGAEILTPAPAVQDDGRTEPTVTVMRDDCSCRDVSAVKDAPSLRRDCAPAASSRSSPENVSTLAPDCAVTDLPLRTVRDGYTHHAPAVKRTSPTLGLGASKTTSAFGLSAKSD